MAQISDNSLANLKPWKKGQSGNIAGPKPGYKHVSTWVNEMLNDETFTVENFLGQHKAWKGAPMKAIMTVAIYQALSGDVQWAKWLTDNATKLDKDDTGNTTNIQIINYVRAVAGLPAQSSPTDIPRQ